MDELLPEPPLQPIYTAKTKDEKQTQNKYFFWYKNEFRDWIRNRLTKLKRPDLANILLGSENRQNTGPKVKKDYRMFKKW